MINSFLNDFLDTIRMRLEADYPLVTLGQVGRERTAERRNVC